MSFNYLLTYNPFRVAERFHYIYIYIYIYIIYSLNIGTQKDLIGIMYYWEFIDEFLDDNRSATDINLSSDGDYCCDNEDNEEDYIVRKNS